MAAAKGYNSVLEALFASPQSLISQLDVNVRDAEGWTALAAAVYWQQTTAVEILLNNGADIEVKTSTGRSLVDLAEDNEAILALLEERRKKLEAERKRSAAAAASAPNGPTMTPVSPPSAASTAESETQRRAHAKRVRETRRSTQGISADDVNKAKDILTQQQTQPGRMDFFNCCY